VGEPGDDGPGRPGSIGRTGRPPRRGIWGVTRSILLLEHAQDVITIAVGILLILVSAFLLVSGIADFGHALATTRILSTESIVSDATGFLDEILLVLILVEIVHTVVLSLHSHRLVAQPFIVVGLIAVIRKILFVLSGQKTVSTSVLALLIAMAAVFILGLIAVSRFEKSIEPDGDS
jgi:uncharacterized membrane protein (DUF373 family)